MNVSASLLDAMKRAANDLMPETVTIRRKNLATDNQGGQTETWANLSTVAARVSPQPGRPGERESSGRPASVADWAITVPAATDVTAKDRILWGSRTFEVVSTGARSYEVCRRLECVEVV